MPAVLERTPIRQLPVNLINRIAAGEVIERPASVVKELVENALDAGATAIDVEISDGGRARIRVIDNGGGIPADELPLAFAAHATSKLSRDEDLMAIATMGFRGEALASIGSVSRCSITSRAAGDDIGYEINNHAGVIDTPQAAACNAGTLIDVRDLFFNVPARRKFLKGASTEFGHINDVLTKLALASPHISFRLTHEGRASMDLPAADERTRWLCGWPREYAEGALPLDRDDAELHVRGIVGLPEYAAVTGRYQHVFINGRFVRDKTITHALREAFRGLTEPGRQPAAVVMISMPPDLVDVNVHPAKTEVRFRDSGRIHQLVFKACREVLAANDLSPRPVFTVPVAGVVDAESERVRRELADFFRTPQPAGQASLMDAGTGQAPIMPAAQAEDVNAWHRPAAHEFASKPSTEPWAGGSDFSVSAGGAFPVPTGALQLHNSYLVVQAEDGLEIIDQHALHERILYEELLARVQRGTLESQRMLIPIVVIASPSQVAVLEKAGPLLERLGIDAQPLGPDAVAVHAFPSFLGRLDPGAFVLDLLERGDEESLDFTTESAIHGVLDMMACKAAVKAGEALTGEEVAALLARRHATARSSNCPHGRPTTLKMSLRELEKQFKRTGF